jgi:hypothetical protein
MKKSQVLNIVIHKQNDVDVTMAAPIKGFGAAFDGPSVDPKQMQQQQVERQRQAEDRARKQRELLQQQAQQGMQPPPGPVAATPDAVTATTPAAK